MRQLITLSSTILLLAACGPDNFLMRRDIQSDISDGHTAAVRIDVDWLQDFNSEPTGMSALLFPTEGSSANDASNNVKSVDFKLRSDTWRLLLFNLTPDEFGSLEFSGLDNYDSARVDLLPSSMKGRKSWSQTTTFMQEPESIAVALDTITIAQDLTATDCDYTSGSGDTAVYVYNVTPRSFVTTLSVKVKVNGLAYARSVEASVDGMANGYMLTQQHATASTGTYLLDDWKGIIENKNDSSGYITTSIQTFGLPYEPNEDIANRDSTKNMLTLYFLLRDGKTTRIYHYPVGNKFRYTTTIDGIQEFTTEQTLSLDIDIESGDVPDLPKVDDPDNGASGFSAEVDPWDNGGTTDIDF